MAEVSQGGRQLIEREIDRVACEFERALRRGERLRIEECLSKHAHLGPELRWELLLAEIDFCREQRLEVDWDGYLSRFPDEAARLRERRLNDRTRLAVAAEETPQASHGDSVCQTDHAVTPREMETPAAPLDLSDYVLGERLGKGGQGEVFHARQRSLDRPVAIKLLSEAASRDPLLVKRFLREARIVAQARHPHIVTIHGIGRGTEGRYFLVMEHVGGPDLSKQIAARQFGVDEAVRIVEQVAAAIEYAHECGVIHRDLKPSNILWDPLRGPLVTDFGLAKDLRTLEDLTLTEQLLGTPTFMAPEQAHPRYGEVSRRTDVYGLGAILFALLTGSAPHGTGALVEVLQRLIGEGPVPDPASLRSDVPRPLADACQRAIARKPSDRFASAQELGDELRRWRDGRGRDEPSNRTSAQAPVPVKALDGRPAATAPLLEPGGTFGPFRLVASLTSDQTRKTFRAVDETGRQVLLKCLPDEWLADRQKRSHFRQEALLSSRLAHPCLAKVLAAGTIDRTEYVALEWFDGVSAAEHMAHAGPFAPQRAAEILCPVAEALHLIHGTGVIYRDLRPQNIMLIAEGQPMLADVRFSDELAPHDNVTLGGTGQVTTQYVAPELLLGRPSDVASDVYSLGSTLYSLVTGHVPFEDAPDALTAMIQKMEGRHADPRQHVPDLGDALCQLMADALASDPSKRPATAQDFARRLSQAALPTPPATPVSRAQLSDDQLLHGVWEHLEPDLQDAFSLAYNKKRRSGSTRISTRDLFDALARLGSGSMRRVLDELPVGAVPEPTGPAAPLDRRLLSEQPQLSDCVRSSLAALGPHAGTGKVASVDLFVDVAKHGHGPSVVRLREHGVDAEYVERVVRKLGVRVARRDTSPADAASNSTASKDIHGDPSENLVYDDNVQFSVYRPKSVPSETWVPLLVFAHLSELPPSAGADAVDPIQEVQRQAAQVLGELLPDFRTLSTESEYPLPRAGEVTFVPSGEGLEFNPPQRTFRWLETVHREEFRFKAAARLDGQLARGRVSVFLGSLLIAEVAIVTRVDGRAGAATGQPLTRENRAYRFRRIYACVSEADESVVAECRRYAQAVGDTIMLSTDRGDDPEPRIRSADVFQLYWSRQVLASPRLEKEWRFALSLGRPEFIRALYWEEPFPTAPHRSLPPAELLALGFHKLPSALGTAERLASGPTAAPTVVTSAREARQFERAEDLLLASAEIFPGSPPSRDVVPSAFTTREAARLEVLSGPNQGQLLRLTKHRTTLGRHPEADLALATPSVNRFHAQIVQEADEWWIEDLQSRNGTYLNGMQITTRTHLKNGDKLQVGNVVLAFRAPAGNWMILDEANDGFRPGDVPPPPPLCAESPIMPTSTPAPDSDIDWGPPLGGDHDDEPIIACSPRPSDEHVTRSEPAPPGLLEQLLASHAVKPPAGPLALPLPPAPATEPFKLGRHSAVGGVRWLLAAGVVGALIALAWAWFARG